MCCLKRYTVMQLLEMTVNQMQTPSSSHWNISSVLKRALKAYISAQKRQQWGHFIIINLFEFLLTRHSSGQLKHTPSCSVTIPPGTSLSLCQLTPSRKGGKVHMNYSQLTNDLRVTGFDFTWLNVDTKKLIQGNRFSKGRLITFHKPSSLKHTVKSKHFNWSFCAYECLLTEGGVMIISLLRLLEM